MLRTRALSRRAYAGGGLEAQIAVVGDRPEVPAQVEATRSIASRLRDGHPGLTAPGNGTLPSHARLSELPTPATALVQSIALGDDTLEPSPPI